MKNKIKESRGVLYALISSSTFGLIPLFALPIIKSGMGTPSILFYRFGLAALLMGVLTLIQRKSFRITRRELGTLTILGWLYAGTALGLLLSYSMIPSGVATTIHFLYPVLVAALMMLFFKEAKSLWLLVATLLSILGVGMMSWSDGAINYGGILTVLCTVITYGIYIVGVNKSGVAHIDSIPLTFYVLLAGSVMFGAYALLTTGVEPIPDLPTGVNIALLALVPTVISDLTLVLAVKHAGSTITSILGSMEPLTAVIIGIIYFAEPFGMGSLCGLFLILMSVVVVILKRSPR